MLGCQGITNAIILEFDLYSNSEYYIYIFIYLFAVLMIQLIRMSHCLDMVQQLHK